MVTLLEAVLCDDMYGHQPTFNSQAIWMDEPPLQFFRPTENLKNTTPQSMWMGGKYLSWK